MDAITINMQLIMDKVGITKRFTGCRLFSLIIITRKMGIYRA